MAAAEKLIFLYLLLFPFGQIIRLNINLLGVAVPIRPIDLVAGVSFLYIMVGRFKKPLIFKQIAAFLIVAVFSYLFSFILLPSNKLYIGGLYLLRLFAYTSLFLLVFNVVSKRAELKKVLFNSLILVVVFVGIFGWLQYFLYPDIRAFVVWGWDNHLYRLLGTFLDPGFTSIILVFGFLLSLVKYLETKNRRLFALLAFFLLTIAFTYSRAGYLALGGGLLTIFGLRREIKSLWPTLLVFLLIVAFLPRPSSEGVRLERLSSVYSRVENYSEGIEIFGKSPIFGVGYNNLCLARQKYLGRADFTSHACSGLDSSLLLILATTGVVGFLILANLGYEVIRSVKGVGVYGLSFLACLVALLVHSLFVNSLFYPWVMGFMGITLSLSLKESKG